MIRLVFACLIISSCIGLCRGQSENRAYGLILDNSGSLRSQLPLEKELAVEIGKHVASGKGSMSVFVFRTASPATLAEPTLGLDWTRDETAIERYVETVVTVPGQTKLIDSMLRVGEAIVERAGTSEEKILLMISDGEDRASVAKSKDLIRYLKANRVRIYAVGLVNELLDKTGFISASPRRKATDFLRDVTKETEGRLVLPKGGETASDGVRELFEGSEKSK